MDVIGMKIASRFIVSNDNLGLNLPYETNYPANSLFFI